MNKSLRSISDRPGVTSTPQTEKAVKGQIKNSAGGYSFKDSDINRLRKFLIIGTEGGTYYASEKELSVENAKLVFKYAEKDSRALVDNIVDVSDRGLSVKQDSCIFALAVAASKGDPEDQKYALSQLGKVARTGTQLFTFADFVQNFRGWGRALRSAMGAWYTEKDLDKLAYQVIKYRNRNGWTHRDVLRLAHPKAVEPGRQDLFKWIVSGDVGESAPRLLEGFIKAQAATTAKEFCALIQEYKLSWEMLPTQALTYRSVWETLLRNSLPLTATLRNLGKMTSLDMFDDFDNLDIIKNKFGDSEYLKKSRIHPISILSGMSTYSSGHGVKGSLSWSPSRQVIDTLDKAFYDSFEAVEPTNKRTMLSLDISGSMGWESAFSGLTPRDLSAALSMVTAAVEDKTYINGFSTSMRDLDISPRRSLLDNVRTIQNLPFGGTDIAKPMQHALNKGLKVDTFIIYTDGETWAGYQHPFQALERYRKETGIPAKLIVNGMTATGSTVCNPDDAGSMAVVGFDSSAPKLMADFSRGDF